MDKPILPAHSLLEAELYMKIAGCPSCPEGRLRPVESTQEETHIDTVVRLDWSCELCGASVSERFRMDSQWDSARQPPLLNPGSAHSQIIDLAQWLSLFHLFRWEAEQTGDKEEARRIRYVAALCLDEALKFYEADNDLPPPRAFRHERSRRHARESPQQFTRQNLLRLRSELPDLKAMQRVQGEPRSRWRFWKARGE